MGELAVEDLKVQVQIPFGGSGRKKLLPNRGAFFLAPGYVHLISGDLRAVRADKQIVSTKNLLLFAMKLHCVFEPNLTLTAEVGGAFLSISETKLPRWLLLRSRVKLK